MIIFTEILKISRCDKTRLIFARKKLKPAELVKLNDHLETISFVCGQALFPKTKEFKELTNKEVCIDRTKLCDSSHETFLYKMMKENQQPPCGWCVQNLSTDQVSKFTSLVEDHDTVIPNCGSQQCLKSSSRITTRKDGFYLKGPGKRARNLKRKRANEEKKRKKRRLNPSN